jgi:uncharacterized surface protein with fasciclin (FAS1) repeats
MKRLLTGTAIAALLATPVIAQSYSSETAEYFSNSTFSANVAELPEEYDAQDLNNIVLAKVERHYEENDVNRVTYVSKPNDAGERYATVTDTNDWLSGKNVGLLETAQSDERFTTLVSLIEMSADDLGLQEDEEYTIFAPVNDAFMQLSADRVNYLTSQMGARERTDILTVPRTK